MRKSDKKYLATLGNARHRKDKDFEFCSQQLLSSKFFEFLQIQNLYLKLYIAKIAKLTLKLQKITLKMDFRIIELQKKLSENEKNTFNYKFERQKKTVSTGVLLALFLGGFGIHKFWLNEIVPGVLYLLFCWTFIPAIIALIECLFMKNTVNNYNYRLAKNISKEIEMLR